MSTLAVIGTFYKRHENTLPLFNRVLVESTIVPDEFWVMCEGEDDVEAATAAYNTILPSSPVHILHYPTPLDIIGHYSVIPYSNKINYALDQISSDYVCFLDNGSMPHPTKYEVMKQTLDDHPEWGAVYCSQRRTGFMGDAVHWGDKPFEDAYCILNYTQVMFRKTDARWTLELRHATPNDVADGIFWRELHKTLGPFYPVPVKEALDTHHMESLKAVGL